MQSLATDILRNEKRKCTFWEIATVIVLAVTIAEFVVIVFQKVGIL